jgi:hypothetical protein
LRILNKYLDRLAGAGIHLRQKGWTPFEVCAYVGAGLALLLAMSLVACLGLSYWVLAVLVLSSVATYFALAMITRRIMGQDWLIFYHHMMAVLLVATVALRLMGQPILPYLDVTMLALGAVLACGRLGCLMVGCCHGRPYGWGVCYREEHAAVSFTPYFVGVRLFPIQAVESLWAFGLVLVGVVLLLGAHPAGDTLTWFVMTYALGRFCFEFMRGEPGRLYLAGFSEAQWTSLVLIGIVVWAELTGFLALHLWHVVATVCVASAMIGVAVIRRWRRTAKHLLLHPHHVDEVAHAVAWASNLTTEEPATSGRGSVPALVKVGCTSLGIQISAGIIEQAGTCMQHYALSSQTGTMTEETARTLARLILQLRHPRAPNEFIVGNRGVFHLLIQP